MATPKNKAVAKVEVETVDVVSSEMPEWMKGEEKKGLEALDSTDFILPIVKLMQATDVAVQEGTAQAGSFYHMTSKVNIGKEVTFIPCHIRKRYMLFRPNDGSGGTGSNVLARSDDGIHWSPANAAFEVTLKSKKKVVWKTKSTIAESGLDKFGSSDPEDPQSNPAATLIYDIVAILPDHEDLSPAVISLKGSAVTRAKNLNTVLRSSKAPIWGHVFGAKGSLEKNGNNSYWAYNLDGKGYVNNPELFKLGKELHDTVSQSRFGVAEEESTEEAAPENSKY